MKIRTNTPNYDYNWIIKSALQCKDSMILISHKNITRMN
jgi:pyruvate/2-oxoglutarate/acetoin dehydrogenase E1 component